MLLRQYHQPFADVMQLPNFAQDGFKGHV